MTAQVSIWLQTIRYVTGSYSNWQFALLIDQLVHAFPVLFDALIVPYRLEKTERGENVYLEADRNGYVRFSIEVEQDDATIDQWTKLVDFSNYFCKY